jgi:hypothetical protein
MWIVIAVFLFLSHFSIDYFRGVNHIFRWSVGGSAEIARQYSLVAGSLSRQLLGKLQIILNIAVMIAFGVFISRANNLRDARIKLIGIMIVFFVYMFAITTERGWTLMIGIGAGAYADIIRWEGRLLSWRLILFGIFIGMIINVVTSIIESFLLSGYIGSFVNWPLVRFVCLDVSPVQITGNIVSWIDEGFLSLRLGQTYVDALKSIIPSQFHAAPLLSLSRWFIWEYNPTAAQLGHGLGFSAIAEGYLNGGILGVLVHGLLIGALCSGIRFFKTSCKFKNYGPFLYCANIAWVYRVYQLDSGSIIKHFQWYSIITVLLLWIGVIFLKVARRRL